MATVNFIARQHLNHDQFGYLVVDEGSGRCLGGVGANYHRPWVFPLYTPSGLTVLQEFPFDHPFHNGFWVAQGPIIFAGREVQFWPSPPMRKANEALFANMGRMAVQGKPQIEVLPNGVRFTMNVCWRDKAEVPVLDEIRTVDLYKVDDATVCDMSSQKVATYGALDYSKTKFGSIGIRVEPQLLPVCGGEIVADGSRRGKAEVAIDQANQFVAYENKLATGHTFGVLLTNLDASQPTPSPWFIRDYGLAYYGPTRGQAIHTPAGESWTVSLRVVAYDGALTEEHAQQWSSSTTRTPHAD